MIRPKANNRNTVSAFFSVTSTGVSVTQLLYTVPDDKDLFLELLSIRNTTALRGNTNFFTTGGSGTMTIGGGLIVAQNSGYFILPKFYLLAGAAITGVAYGLNVNDVIFLTLMGELVEKNEWV